MMLKGGTTSLHTSSLEVAEMEPVPGGSVEPPVPGMSALSKSSEDAEDADAGDAVLVAQVSCVWNLRTNWGDRSGDRGSWSGDG